MSTESEQLRLLLQTVAQNHTLSPQHKLNLLQVLRESSDLMLRDAWSALSPSQCERLWAIARSVYSSR